MQITKNLQNPLDVMQLRTAALLNKKSATFGMVRIDDKGNPRPHQGIDLVAPIGTRCYAVANGMIVGVNKAYNGYGWTVAMEFEYNNRTLYAFYAHLSEINVHPGEFVRAGEVIAYTGDTGNAKNARHDDDHLHFEIRTSQYAPLGLANRLDPLTFFKVTNYP